MKAYFICPVRNATQDQIDECDKIVKKLESDGVSVHYPPRDVNQNCLTGVSIVKQHRTAMIDCDVVYVYWDSKSSGSHFDLGMAMALGKDIKPCGCVYEDDPNVKSYWKVINNIGDVYGTEQA